MRKCIKGLIGTCAAVVIALCIPSVNVYAADTYTITFRPGNVGYFAIEANAEGDRQDMAEAVAEQQYGGYEYEVTANGAIKVEVAAGAVAPQAPIYIQAEDGYFVKNAASWGPDGQAVDRNADYVVDYGKLVNGVEYVVEYVDSASGESIAPVYIVQANVGESRTVTAPAQIITGGSSVYNLVSAGSMEMVLDEDATRNVFTFAYTMEPLQPIVEVITETETITRTEYETIILPGVTNDNNTASMGGNENEGNTVNAEQDDDDNTNINRNEDNTANPDAEQNAANENAGIVTIEDQEIPLADQEAEKDYLEDVVDIEDGEVPLSDGEEPFAHWAVIGAVIFMVAAVSVTVVWIVSKKKQISRQNNVEE